MTGAPAVSVVIPTRNRCRLLRAALDSVETQNLRPTEVIVVSDGSSDGTDELVRDRGLRLVRTDGVGAGGARNAGWRAATSEIVAFTDDDCVARPDWLERLIAPFEGAPSLAIAQGRTVPAAPAGPDQRSLDVSRETGLYETCNIAYRRQALEVVGGFDEGLARSWGHFGEDVELAWRVKRAGWESRFVEAATVEHHVFDVSLISVIGRQWACRRFPALVKRVPELRAQLPGGRWFLRSHGPWVQLALLGLLISIRSPRAGAVMSTPYLLWLLRNVGLTKAPRQVLLDLVTSAALLQGSLESRSILF